MILSDKLTIAIPVYNDTTYIQKTIESCVRQAGCILIFDNCSTDGTSEICSNLARQHSHIRYVRNEKNLGAFDNFKKPLFECQTEYFCWLGSHDIHGDNFSRPLLEGLDHDPQAVLAVGTIQHIDESGKFLKKRSTMEWVRELQNKTPLERMQIFIGRLQDCFMFHGIYRTEALKRIWFDIPCLGFDEAMLIRTAAEGTIIYDSNSLFLARDFVNSRKNQDPQERRAKVVAAEDKQPLQRNLFVFNKIVAETILSHTHAHEDMTLAFKLMDTINKRYHRPKYFKNRRQKIKIAIGLCALLFILAIIF